jgi:hypothetical protein
MSLSKSELLLVKKAFDGQKELPTKKEMLTLDEGIFAKQQADYYALVNKKHERLRLAERFLRIAERFLRIAYGYIMFGWVLWISTTYLGFVRGLIDGVSTKEIIGLTDNVIIAILTSTTATIIGLPYVIINSLFPKDKIDKSSKNSEN